MQQIKKPYEGLFITIEGGEGCGKSTLAESLAKEMQDKGYHVLKTREPGGAPLAEKIRDLLLHHEAIPISAHAELLLFLAARAQHIDESILPALRAEKVVICERFHDSTVAYQGCGRELGMKFVEDLCRRACFELIPDCTLLLDIDPIVARERIGKRELDRVEREKLEFHKLVRQAFLHLADQHPHRIEVIDASLPNCCRPWQRHVLQCRLVRANHLRRNVTHWAGWRAGGHRRGRDHSCGITCYQWTGNRCRPCGASRTNR